ncbi:TIM barrel protein [Patescibacteria group bacterium]
MDIKVGLKSKWTFDQLDTRIFNKLDLIEIYLDYQDLEKRLDLIEENLRFLKEKHKNISITIHQPEKFKDNFLNLASLDFDILNNTYECLHILSQLADRYNLGGVIIHPYWSEDEKYKNDNVCNADKAERLISNLKNISQYKNIIFLENEISGCFSFYKDILNVLEKTEFRLALDFCHLRIASKNNKEFIKNVDKLGSHISYCHLSDTKGVQDDAMELGKGVINWCELVKYIKIALIEVEEKDYINIPKMLNSFNYFKKICYQNTISKAK